MLQCLFRINYFLMELDVYMLSGTSEKFTGRCNYYENEKASAK